MTVVMLLMSRMFFVGSPSTRIMSASFPGAITPRSLSTPINLEFVVECVSRQRIGSRNHRHARVINCRKQAQHRWESIAISCLFVWRNLECTAPHRAPHLRWKTRHDFFQSGRNCAGIAAKKRFKDVYRRIEHGVMVLEKIDELAHFGFVPSKFAGALSDFCETIAVARFF